VRRKWALCSGLIAVIEQQLAPTLFRRRAMLALKSQGCSFIADVRGKGLLNAVEVDPSKVLCLNAVLISDFS
jgi:acetylornithine/succinyldiaminopimelate/putrescine aminotransferase